MSNILNLALAAITAIRQTEAEPVRLHFNGGTAPQFNIELTEPLVGEANYTFSGNVDSISSGGVTGICFGGGASATITATGPFSEAVQAETGADGQTIFSVRGQNGTYAVISNPALTPVE